MLYSTSVRFSAHKIFKLYNCSLVNKLTTGNPSVDQKRPIYLNSIFRIFLLGSLPLLPEGFKGKSRFE
uniref:Uncharacterized protein n=1 Tax=Pararge aegeria TaxID=116150 RepID=S4PDV3_9NEOP